MAIQFKNNFTKGVNLDLDELRMPPDACLFIKNLTDNVNANPGTSAAAGSNQYVRTPIEGNEELSITLPAGDNYTIGFYSSEATNEGYFAVHNSNNNHSVWVISGDTGSVRKVYQGSLLPFDLDPTHFLSEGRMTLQVKTYTNRETGLEDDFKFLIFTNNNGVQCFISVEDSIDTSSYTLPTGYFAGAGTFYDPIELIHLGVPTPLNTIEVAEVPTEPEDLELQNQLIRNGWQFRIKNIDVFGRESEHGIISDQYISIVGGGCISTSNGMPRCVDITFDAGNPFVDLIQIEYRKWVGDTRGPAISEGWLIYDTIEKWDNSMAVRWFDRDINPNINYDLGTNKITYRFCADKKNEIIPPDETIRTQPGVPILSNGVFSLNKRIGLVNNVHDFDPIDPAEIAKVTFGVETPSAPPCEAPPLRKVVVFANIFRIGGEYSIYGSSGIVRKSGDTAVWGNVDQPCGQYGSFSMDQVFGDQENPGFIMYCAGMTGAGYSTVMQQGNFNPATGDFTYTGYTGSLSFPNMPMQRAEFNIPAGKYVLRIASHKAKLSDDNLQKTSTYVAGKCIVGRLQADSGNGRFDYAEDPIKEIEIDCTNGDVILNGFSGIYGVDGTDPTFIILDLTALGGSAIDGYLTEDNRNNIPVEMNPVYFTGNSDIGTTLDAYGSFFTDHNGFFFGVSAISSSGSSVVVKIDAATNSVSTSNYVDLSYSGQGIKHGDGSGTNTNTCYGVSGNWLNKLFLYKDQNYPVCGRRYVEQRVLLCDTTTGVPGIPIVMTKGAVAFTDSNGNAVIIAHNRYKYSIVYSGLTLPPYTSSLPDYGASPNNKDFLVFTQKGGCNFSACIGCADSVPDVAINYKGYTDCIDCDRCRDTISTDVEVNIRGANIFGVQSGGRYAVGFVLHDEIGRHTSVQVAQGDAQYVDIPNLNDSTYLMMALSSINFAIDAGVQFPPNFKKMTFCVGENVAFSDFISLSADWVQKVDNAGNTNETNPTSIRIYYGSLNEYNKQYNFSTNTGWQFISTGQNAQGSPVTGDVVQFIMNGDGTWFDAVISAPVTYDRNGLFFTIEYTNELSSLTNGALFRVIRPVINKFSYVFYEQNLSIELVDGVPQTLSGVLPYFDSYMLNRLLPVPILKGQPGPIAPGGTPVNPIQYTSTNETDVTSYATSNNNSNGVVIMSTTDAQTSYPFFFESPSPSDFWGSHLANRGRVLFYNPIMRQKRIGTEMYLSDQLGDRSNINGLSYFQIFNSQVFDRNTWGNITAALVEVGTILVICESDHFLTRYQQSNLGLDENNNVVAKGNYGPFTTPDRRNGTPFGCIPFNANTIRKHLGIVYWLDAKGRLVKHDYSQAVSVEEEHGYYGYLLNKIAAVNELNVEQLCYFVGGVDPKTKEYNLTSYNLTSPSYINTESEVDLYANETMIVDLTTGRNKGFVSYTPECYGMIPGYYLQKQFLSFKEGVPYIHHKGITSTSDFATFYGVACEVRVTLVVNPSSEKVKRFLWIEVYTKANIAISGQLPEALLYADIITTEKSQTSRLSVSRFDIRDGFACAEFLCDLDTPADSNIPVQTGANALLDGNQLQGRWLSASFTNNPLWDNSYFELSAIVGYVNGVEKSAS